MRNFSHVSASTKKVVVCKKIAGGHCFLLWWMFACKIHTHCIFCMRSADDITFNGIRWRCVLPCHSSYLESN